MRNWMTATLGALLCSVLAAGLTLLFYASTFKTLVPFLFIAPILLVALRFGSTAGVLGTIAAALIFASSLFEPRLSLVVRDLAARSNLIWMVLLGLIISELLGRGKTKPTRLSNPSRWFRIH
jgi:K+-sensing histidine kinase KdpD